MNAPTSLAEMKTGQQQQPDVKVDFFSRNGFELACRISKALATSDAVPAQFRQYNEKKDENGKIVLIENTSAIGNCLVALEVSQSIGMSVIAVMQNADVIQGKLRWSSRFQIAAINASRRFSPLKFKLHNLGRIKAKCREKTGWNKALKRYDFVEHEIEIDNWECVAWAYELDANKRPTKEVVQSIPVTMQMAVEEGWYLKEGSKWQGSMRFQMLQYRAGTFFGSIYAPDVLMGMGKSTEEANDVIDVVPQADGSFAASSTTLQELRSATDIGTTINPTTGEVIKGEPGHDPQDDALRDLEQSGDASAPTFEDAIAAVKAGDHDLAADMARSFPDGQKAAVLKAIENARTPAAEDKPSGRRPSGSMAIE